MLEFTPRTAESEKEVLNLLMQIEERRERRLLCLYQNHIRGTETVDDLTVVKVKDCLEELGKQDKIAVFLESPGGDIDCCYRMVRLLRHYANDVEVLVGRWAKSGATFFCLGANTIYMGRDAEFGPLDTQLHDPRGSIRPTSALNAFKSLEYLRQYVLETLDQVVLMLMEHGGMDIPYALEAARPLVSDIVSPLYRQVNPHELGEARRHLAVGEEYSKIVMKRYSYRNLSDSQIEKMVQKLVWDYPSHGFVIDLEGAQDIGLNAKLLDPETASLCERLLSTVDGCFGFRSVGGDSATPSLVAEPLAEKVEGNA